ncbi:MAG: hypothetical protein K6U88_06420 [Dehalococcoidia bacterium]|nr:hypothetical protein [Dehalococcoidia bacterium]
MATPPLRIEEIRGLRAGKSLPAHRVVELRSKAMHAIRTEFVVRMLRAHRSVDTLTVHWEGARQAMLSGQVEERPWRLVCGRGGRVSGEFQDLWLLCYPEDEEVRTLIEDQIERMVAEVNALREDE